MRLTIEVEVHLVEGNLSGEKYYGFSIPDGPASTYCQPFFRCSEREYPGNDAMRKYFNKKIANQLLTSE